MNRLWIKLSLAFTGVTLFTISVLLLLLFWESVDRRPLSSVEDAVEQMSYWAEDPLYEAAEEGTLEETAAELKEKTVHALDRLTEEIRREYETAEWEELPEPGAVFLEFFARLFSPDILLILTAGALSGIAAGLLLSRPLSSPLRKLSQAAANIGRRDLSYRVEIGGTREFVDLARAFNRMAEDLEKADRAKKDLTADIAHELRTPLTVLEGGLQACLDGVYPLNEETAAALYSQTRHLVRLVEDLHQLARAEAYRLPFDIDLFDLGELAEEAREAFSPLAGDRGITLRTIKPPHPIRIRGIRPGSARRCRTW